MLHIPQKHTILIYLRKVSISIFVNFSTFLFYLVTIFREEKKSSSSFMVLNFQIEKLCHGRGVHARILYWRSIGGFFIFEKRYGNLRLCIFFHEICKNCVIRIMKRKMSTTDVKYTVTIILFTFFCRVLAKFCYYFLFYFFAYGNSAKIFTLQISIKI